MRTNTQTLLDEFATLAALLRGEVRIHSNHLMSSVFSFGFKDVEKGTPRGIHDGFRKMMVLDHIRDVKVLNGDMMVLLGVVFRRLKVEITALTANLQVSFRRITSGLAASVTAFLASAHLTLFAPQSALRRPIKARVVYRVAITISQEGLQAHINADIRMRTGGRCMFGSGLGFTHHEGVPMTVRTMDKVNRLGRSL